MNSPVILLIASIVASSMRSGCAAPEVPEVHTARADQVQLERMTEAICEVGRNGEVGTLIGSRWVLTTGHSEGRSVEEKDRHPQVIFRNGDVYTIEQVFVHPSFEPTKGFGVALIELSDEVVGIEPVTCCGGRDGSDEGMIPASHLQGWIDSLMLDPSMASHAGTSGSGNVGS